MEMVTKWPDVAKRLRKLETVLSGGAESMTRIRNQIGAKSRLAAASVCIGRQRIAIGGGGMRQNTMEAVKRSGKVMNCNGKMAEAAEDDERQWEAAEVADRRRIGTDCDGSMYCVLDRVFGA